jgi:hypothetical protein
LSNRRWLGETRRHESKRFDRGNVSPRPELAVAVLSFSRESASARLAIRVACPEGACSTFLLSRAAVHGHIDVLVDGGEMKKSILCASVSVLAGLLMTSAASAAQITYVSIAGYWHDAMDNVPGTQPGDPVITNGNPTSIIRWGETMGTPQSGYDFTATLPPPQTFPGPAPLFSLGTFTHRNFEVGDPALTQVQLDVVLVLNIDGVQTGPVTFTYTFHHEETPNYQVPCPYPTPPGEGCTDRVTIISAPQPTTLKIGGIDYTLTISFLNNGNPVSR